MGYIRDILGYTRDICIGIYWDILGDLEKSHHFWWKLVKNHGIIKFDEIWGFRNAWTSHGVFFWIVFWLGGRCSIVLEKNDKKPSTELLSSRWLSSGLPWTPPWPAPQNLNPEHGEFPASIQRWQKFRGTQRAASSIPAVPSHTSSVTPCGVVKVPCFRATAAGAVTSRKLHPQPIATSSQFLLLQIVQGGAP